VSVQARGSGTDHDINFWRAGLLPGKADANEQNYKTDHAVEGVL